MNAGCYGSEFKDIVLDVNFLNRNGKKIKKKAKEIDFKYRESNIPKDLIITSVNLMGFKKNKEEIKRKICEISKKRISSQPQGYPTGGSTFKNYKNYKAWELISKLGVSNLRCGGAMISDFHNNFMINTGKAKASDFENFANRKNYHWIRHKTSSMSQFHSKTWLLKINNNFLLLRPR